MRTIGLSAMLAALVAAAGCNGMTQSYEDRKNTYSEVFDTNMKQFADDWDTFWLADRPSRLTPVYTR